MREGIVMIETGNEIIHFKDRGRGWELWDTEYRWPLVDEKTWKTDSPCSLQKYHSPVDAGVFAPEDSFWTSDA